MTTTHDPILEGGFGTAVRGDILDAAARASIRRRVLDGVAQRRYEEDARRAYDPAKRAFDFALALIGAVITLPLVGMIALLIRVDSPGPVFFRQERLGKGAQPFTMLKFRTMYASAVELPEEILKQNESTGPLFKIRRDPRITRTGRWLRRLSLDELPQVYNVLLGEMSMVGPRPPLPRELAGYDTAQRLRLRVLPGLTGLWQVSGRSDLSFDDMVRLDLRYIEERTLLMDLAIVVKTLPVVLTGKGAY